MTLLLFKIHYSRHQRSIYFDSSTILKYMSTLVLNVLYVYYYNITYNSEQFSIFITIKNIFLNFLTYVLHRHIVDTVVHTYLLFISCFHIIGNENAFHTLQHDCKVVDIYTEREHRLISSFIDSIYIVYNYKIVSTILLLKL